MKLKIALISAVACAAFAAPVNAQGVASIIGQLKAVSGDVLIERGGQFFKAQENSAVLKGDRIVTKNGANVQINITNPQGALQCGQSVNSVKSVLVGQANFCENIKKLSRLTANDPASKLSSITGGQTSVSTGAASASTTAGAAATTGTVLGTAMTTSTMLAIAGAAVAVGTIVAVADDSNNTPASP
ncbi:MAG: hypothetical protein ACPGVT_06280 [Maricaulaceae bacterium]